MHQTQRQQTLDLLAARGIQQALFANPASITWLTGFAPPVQLGPNPFLGGPPLLWVADGHFTLLILDGHAPFAEHLEQEPDCTVVTYQGYTIQEPIDGPGHLRVALEQLLHGAAKSAVVGLESQHLTHYLAQVVDAILTDRARQIPLDGALLPLRMIKNDEELEKLRANFALVDLGQATARRAVQTGQREIDVWTAIHAAVEQAAGRRVAMGNDCTVGYRDFNVGGWPLTLPIRDQDSFIIDLSTQVHGYWSDSCGTYYAGEPTARQQAMHRTAQDALDLAISMVRPGAVARDMDAAVRSFISRAGYPVYPHHTGHGVGVTGHEEPRIVPYNDRVLEAGMVIMLEPGIYLPGETAVRLEDAVLVTEQGAEILTRFDKGYGAA